MSEIACFRQLPLPTLRGMQKKKAGVFSIEMSDIEIGKRFLAANSGFSAVAAGEQMPALSFLF